MSVLSIRNLSKSFGDTIAVQGVSFELEAGSCFGLLGPNGAGKTTTISMIVGVLKPDFGEIAWNGVVQQFGSVPLKRQIGFVSQDLALYDELSAQDNLRFFGSLYGLEGEPLRSRIREVLELTGLQERAAEPVSHFSGGMKRRLNIAIGLLHDPELLVLDEPTVGVDPQSRNAIFTSLQSLRSQGKTLLYTTHYMEEVERLCDRVAVMDHGVIVANDTLTGLQKLLPSRNRVRLTLQRNVDEAELAGVRALADVSSVSQDGQVLQVDLQDFPNGVRGIIAYLSEKKIDFSSISTETKSLEEVFLQLTGRTLRD